MKAISKLFFSTLLLSSALTAPAIALAELRFQKHVPELQWLQRPDAVPDEKRNAIIFAPKGLTCVLPTQDGYCTVPLKWMTTLDHPASLWRLEDDKTTRVAYAYDGAVNAFLRLNQTPTFEIHDGADYSADLMDAVQLNAVWDPNWAQGDIVADNDGSCQIYVDMEACDLSLSWSSTNVKTASVWQRTSSGMIPIVEAAKEGAVSVKAYDFPVVYELRSGTSEDGQLLASALTKGYRVKPEGKLIVPDGESCYIGSPDAVCDLRVKWEGNDISRLWIRETPLSAVRLSGQYLVKVGQDGMTIDLRAGSTAQGEILDRKALSSVLDPNINGSIEGLGICDIPYADQSCQIKAVFETKASNATVWTDEGEIIAQGQSGEFIATATEYGTAYLLKEGTAQDNPILDTYIARGNKLSYTGEITQDGPTECVVPYQRSYCTLSLGYSASDNASLWSGWDRALVGGGQKLGTVPVRVHNYDGASESINSYDLRIHGPSSARITDPLLNRFKLLARRPAHTGTVAPVSTSSCNMIYSRDECEIHLKVTTSSPLVSLWRNDTGEKLWEGSSIASLKVTVPSGEGEYVLREGSSELNDVLSSLTLSANRPSYYMRLSAPAGDSCVSSMYTGSCAISIASETNTTGRLYYRDITNNPDSAWTTLTGSIRTTSTTFTPTAITEDRIFEIEARQYSSPYEPLDRITVKATLNPVHSLSLTSGVPGEADGYPCATFFNSASCTTTHLIAWDTTSPSVSLVWSRDEGQSFFSRVGLNAKTHNASRLFTVGQPHSFYFYEGSVASTSESDALQKGHRLLGKYALPPVKVIPAEKTPVSFNVDSAMCNIVYRDAGSCSITVGVSLDEMGVTHQTRPFYYVRRVDGSRLSARSNSVNTNFSLLINEHEKDVEYQLRVMAGASPADTDPVLDTLLLNHSYQAFSGRVHAAKTNSQSSLSNPLSSFKRSASPYYFERALIGDSFNSFADHSDDCLIHIAQDTCTIYLEASLTSSSAGASVFIDGRFVGGFTSYITSPAWQVVSLPLGTHTIELREGITENAINNRVLDSFEILVARPSYAGTITKMDVLPNINYHGATTSISFPIRSNTSGYLFNKNTGSIVCSVSTFYTAEIFSNYGHATCNQTLGAGDHLYELRTHQDASDSRNQVLDTYAFTLSHEPQASEIRAHQTYPQYFTTCERTYSLKSCLIYFEYKTQYQAEPASGSALSVCAVNADSGAVTRKAGLPLSTAFKGASVRVYESEKLILLVDGPICPSATTGDIPELARWEIETTPPAIDIQYAVRSRSPNTVIKSPSESDTWLCYRRYENDVCNAEIAASFSPAAEIGQDTKAYLALYEANSFMNRDSTSTATAATADTSLSTSVSERDYHVVVCSATTISASGCPKTDGSIHESLTLKAVLPVYTGSIETPDGDYCQGVYDASSCKIRLKIDTDSGYVTVHRDGVYVGYINNKLHDALYEVPVKEKGEKTLYEIRDGSSQNGRIIASKMVTAEIYDPNRFAFVHDVSKHDKDSLDKFCYVSSFVSRERVADCEFDVSYKSDSTEKFLHVTKSSSGNNGTYKIKENGRITAKMTAVTAPYSFNTSPVVAAYTATVYADEKLTQPMDKLIVYQRNTVMGEKNFNAFQGLSVKRSGATLWHQPRKCNYYCSDYYYRIDGNLLLRVNSGSFTADDLTLALPAGCASATTVTNSSIVCNAIDYLSATLTLEAGVQKIGSASFSSTAYNHKRIFYRLSNPSIGEFLTDPVITVNGIARPLDIDHEWHYIDIPHSGTGDVQISASNVSESSIDLTVDLFTEHYPIN